MPAEHTTRIAASSRLAALDGLRLLAALFVVAFHWIGASDRAWQAPTRELFPLAYPVSVYGTLGVQFFFIISGFVICMSSWGRSVGDFFVSRAIRLYPAYWFAVIASAGVSTLLPTVSDDLPMIPKHTSPAEILTNLTMFQEPLGIGPIDQVYWTLWAEIRFYLLFALVVWRGVTYRRVLAFCVAWTIGSIFALNTDFELLKVLLVPKYSMYFIAGVAFYLMHRFRPTLLLWGVVAMCWLLASNQLIAQAHQMRHDYEAPWRWWIAVSAMTVFFLVVAAVALGWLSWMRWRWLTVAGALTYPVYLLHQNIGLITIRVLHPSTSSEILLGGLLAGILALSWLVHRCVERPLAPLMRRGLQRSLDELRGARTGPPAPRSPAPAEKDHSTPTEKSHSHVGS